MLYTKSLFSVVQCIIQNQMEFYLWNVLGKINYIEVQHGHERHVHVLVYHLLYSDLQNLATGL